MKIKLLVLLLILVIPSVARTITIEDALKLALEDSEAVRITVRSSEALRADARKGVAFVKPQARIGARYLRNYSTVEWFPGFETPHWLKSASIEASQVLWTGGRILRSLDLKENLYRLSEITEKSGKRDIRRQVRLAFYGVLFQRAFLDILEDRTAQREEELRDAEDLKNAGMVTSLDVRQAKLNLNNAMEELQTGEESCNRALIDFNISIGRSGREELLVPQGRLDSVRGVETRLKRLEDAFKQDILLDIRLARTDLLTSRLSYEIARRGHLPELQLVTSARSSNEYIGQMDQEWNVGIQLTWNVLDGGLVSSNKAATMAEMQVADNKLKKTRKELAGLVRDLKVSVTSVDRRIELQRESVTLSGENYEDARGQYRAGTITLTRLGELNLAYAEARFRLSRLFYLKRELMIQADALLE
ncbi:outer membrane channel protein [bacterium BMS3Bbin07]|nr:outer membrane channel protein [bacterium BMS3Bbin07]HDH02232.1 TolC family protein [Nitrospirota bacterium]